MGFLGYPLTVGSKMIPNMLQLLWSSCSICSIATDLTQWRKYHPPAFPILANGPTGLNGPLEPAYFSSWELEGWALWPSEGRNMWHSSSPFPLMICFAASPSVVLCSALPLLWSVYVSFLSWQTGQFLWNKAPFLLQVTLRHSVLSLPSCINDSKFNFKVLESFPCPPCVHLPPFKCPTRQLLWDPGTHFSVSLT